MAVHANDYGAEALTNLGRVLPGGVGDDVGPRLVDEPDIGSGLACRLPGSAAGSSAGCVGDPIEETVVPAILGIGHHVAVSVNNACQRPLIRGRGIPTGCLVDKLDTVPVPPRPRGAVEHEPLEALLAALMRAASLAVRRARHQLLAIHHEAVAAVVAGQATADPGTGDRRASLKPPADADLTIAGRRIIIKRHPRLDPVKTWHLDRQGVGERAGC